MAPKPAAKRKADDPPAEKPASKAGGAGRGQGRKGMTGRVRH